MLWLALRFPLLPIEALPLRRSPSAIVARGRVLIADALAMAAGIRPGQKYATALGLLPDLHVFEREKAGEFRAISQLACWAGRLTPTVCLVSPNELLLEIGGCVRLFGGIEVIVDAALAGCREQGYRPDWAVAPTPLGARWLAHSGRYAVYRSMPELQLALAVLPCAIADWSAAIQDRITAFGLRCLGDLRATPLAGLRRRIGNEPVDDLLRAWGEMPDPQQFFCFPEHFEGVLQLPARVEHAEGLMFAGQRLFAALVGWLHARQLLVRCCTLHLMHDEGVPSVLRIALSGPTADEVRLLRLLREHVGRLQLAAPVDALRLVADELAVCPGQTPSLFAEAVAGDGVAACLERLQARLGMEAVQIPSVVADYRPEGATGWSTVLSGEDERAAERATALMAAARHPLWLVPEPQSLSERNGVPQWHGALRLQSSPERIESGWWDQGEHGALGDIRRDYYVACNPQGQWAWIFRSANGWFLHGVFA